MKKNSLLNKFLSFSIGNWIVVLISLVSTPILTRILTPEEYGVYSLFLIVVNLFMIISLLGLDQSYIRFYYEENETERANSLLLSLISAGIMFIVLVTLVIVFRPISMEIMFNTQENIILLLFCVIFFLSVINRYNFVILRMEQKAKLYSTLQVVQKLVDFGSFLALYFVIFDEMNNLHLIIFAYSLATLVVFVVSLVINKKVYVEAVKQFSQLRLSKLYSLLYYGFPLGITVLITWVFQYIDRFMLSNYMSSYEVGIFTAAFKFVAILSIIQTSFTTFWVPVSNKMFIENPKNKMFFEKMFEKVLLFMVIISISIIIFRDFLTIFFGESFTQAIDLLPLLILIPILYTLSEITVVGINFSKKSKIHVYISIVICILSVIFSWYFISAYGMIGAAMSSSLTYVLYFVLRTYFGMKYFRFKILTIKNILLLTALVVIIIGSFY